MQHDDQPGRDEGGVDRRTVLRGLLALGALAATGCSGEAEPDAGSSSSVAPTPTTTTPTTVVPTASTTPTTRGTGDDTRRLRESLESGAARVVIPAGVYDVFDVLLIPWAVREVVLEGGAVIRQHADAPVFRRVGTISRSPRPLAVARRADPALVVRGGLDPSVAWVYACSDDWLKEGKSKRGILRSVTSVDGEQVGIDKPVIGDLVEGARLHVVELAPPVRISGGVLEQADPEVVTANLIRFDFVEAPEILDMELRWCGGAAVRTFGTVGGRIDAHIHDCIDDEANGHYGYGVSASSTTRGLRVEGRIERVRHAFTTDHGWDPLVESISQTGEPEDLWVGPAVADTTATGIDTHEPGDGITIVPDVRAAGSRRWGGINVRARNVTISGGTIDSPNEWGVLVQPSAAGTTRIEGTRIVGVEHGSGVLAKSPTTITDVEVVGFGSAFGVLAEGRATVRVSGGVIDGRDDRGARGIGVHGPGSSVTGTRIVDCAIGVQVLDGAPRPALRRVVFDGCRREVVSSD